MDGLERTVICLECGKAFEFEEEIDDVDSLYCSCPFVGQLTSLEGLFDRWKKLEQENEHDTDYR